MTERNFPEPRAPYPNLLAYAHKHQLTMLTTMQQRNPNGTLSSLWSCSQCPDIFVGGHVGPIPDGWCSCGWVNDPDRKKCAECKRPLEESHARS